MRLAERDLKVVWSAVAAGDLERSLLEAGAVSFSGPETTAVGDQLAMLRDPFGLAVQLVRRKSPLVGEP